MSDRADSFPRPDLFHVQEDEEYARLLREEMDFWNGLSETLLSCVPTERHRRYVNKRLTGDPEREWFETISDFGGFERGCVLGAGPGAVEEHLLRKHSELRLTIFDIAGDALNRIRERLEPQFPGRVETRQADMNFLGLPENGYDIIVSDSCIHHLLNLEHLAFQVNRALTEDGYFFLRDYVGESYFQYRPEERRFYEALVRTTGLEEPTFAWPDRDNWVYSPFEAARSGETLDVFRQHLDERSLRTSNAVFKMMKSAGTAPDSADQGQAHRTLRKLLRVATRARGVFIGQLIGMKALRNRARAGEDLMIELDSLLSDRGDFVPGMAFAVYRKRQHQAE